MGSKNKNFTILFFLFFSLILISCNSGDINIDSSGIAQEANCTDGLDNDGDGLTDCADLNCAFRPVCIDDGGVAGETNCTDGIDNDGDNLIDCTDLNCLSDPACDAAVGDCEDFIDALCDRFGECNEQSAFGNCVSFFTFFTDCETVENLPDPDDCIADLDNFDCVTLTEDTILPDSCVPEGACDVCTSNADCPDDLLCSECFDGLDDIFDDGFFDGDMNEFECTGVVDRCAPLSFFFVDCGDGLF